MYSRSIGTVKWFGGWNHKTERENNFGFISCKSRDVFVHKKNVRKGSDELSEQDIVCFVMNFDDSEGKYYATEVVHIKAELTSIFENHESSSQTLQTLLLDCDSTILKHIVPLIPVAYADIILDGKYRKLLSENQKTELVQLALQYGVQGNEVYKHFVRALILEEPFSNDWLTLEMRCNLLLAFWDKERSSEIAVGIAQLIGRLPAIADYFSNSQFAEFLEYWPEELVVKVVPIVPPHLIDLVLDEDRRKHLTGSQKTTVILRAVEEDYDNPSTIFDVAKQIVFGESIYSNWLASDVRLKMLLQIWRQSEDEKIIGLIAKTMQIIPDAYEQLPEILQANSTVFFGLPPAYQVAMLWNHRDSKLLEIWPELSTATKILCIYRAMQEGENLLLDIATEPDPVVKFGLGVLWMSDKPSEIKRKGFERLHDLLQNHIVSAAWDFESKLDFSPLIPDCSFSKVRYCEGKKWIRPKLDAHSNKTEETIETVYCPRLRGECEARDGQNLIGVDEISLSSGSWTKAIENLPWQNWSLFELMNAAEVQPYPVDGLKDSNEYVNRLAGWINRLIEIRERLQCSKCKEFMYPNMDYSKNLAAYMSTVVSCKHGDEHDKGIYLNHCWACESQIIDSRESKIRIGKYYLCIACGSGPQDKSIRYTQGDVCPHCGLILLNDGGRSRNFNCTECGHTFVTPPTHKLTGTSYEPETRKSFLLTIDGLHVTNQKLRGLHNRIKR